MLRDVIIHITNEQPIMVDLVGEPAPSDTTLICKNVRTMAGKKPVFVDRTDSTFLIPLAHVHFVEMSRASVETHEAEKVGRESTQLIPVGEVEDTDIAVVRPALLTPEASGHGSTAFEDIDADDQGTAGTPSAHPDPEGLDSDLLRRIREV